MACIKEMENKGPEEWTTGTSHFAPNLQWEQTFPHFLN